MGGPAAVTRLIIPVAAGIITALLASVGTEAVAGFGAAVKFERFALLFTMAIATVMAPFTGQNYGAGKIDRIEKGIRFSILSLGIGAVLLALMFLFSRPLASLFSTDRKVIEVTALYFRIVPMVYGMQGIFNISSMVLNALNKPIHAVSLTVFQMFVLYIPLAHLGKRLMGTAGIFSALVVSYTISGILAYMLIQRELRRYSGRSGSGA